MPEEVSSVFGLYLALLSEEKIQDLMDLESRLLTDLRNAKTLSLIYKEGSDSFPIVEETIGVNFIAEPNEKGIPEIYMTWTGFFENMPSLLKRLTAWDQKSYGQRKYPLSRLSRIRIIEYK